jgi:hypothetical protein
LLELRSLRVHETALVERLPDLLATRSQLGAAQDSLREELERLDGQAASLRSQAERSQEVAAQLTNLEGLYGKRRQRLARRGREVSRLQVALNISGPVAADRISALLREATAELASANARRRTHDRAGLLLDLSDDLENPLKRGVEDGLGEEVIARATWNSLSVDELRTAVSLRRDDLIHEVDSVGQELQEEIAGLEQRVGSLEELSEQFRLLGVAQYDVMTVQADIEALLGELSGDAAKKYRQLVDRRSSILDQLVDLSAQIGDLDSERSLLESEGNLEQVRHRLRESEGSSLSREEIDEQIRSTEAETARLTNDLDQARHRADQTLASVEGQYASVSAGAERLLHDPRFVWLGLAGIEAPAEDADVHEKAYRLDELRLAALKIRAEMRDAANAVQALDRTMEALAERIDKEQPAAETGTQPFRFTDDVVRFYQSKFTEQLAAPEIREALFEGGTNLRLDLVTMTTTWVTSTGERRTRPLEAFSSGERAFAYTRVQLEAMRGVAAHNRVAFLDEFGAYVARDRLEELMSFIRRRALRDLADQVVVILPASGNMTPEESVEFAGRSYFARSLDTEVGAIAEAG